ncbi:MAG: hypothetical protein K6T83_16445 [Alicyclobacillus sp.]|nr:hypothetical protein [Alicyclobacillus sp.]
MAHFIDFHIGGWQVSSIGNSSGVFVGQNLQYGWRHSSKLNATGGNVIGDYNHVRHQQTTVLDPDMLDTWVQKGPPTVDLVPPSPALLQALARRRRMLRRAAWEGGDV